MRTIDDIMDDIYGCYNMIAFCDCKITVFKAELSIVVESRELAIEREEYEVINAIDVAIDMYNTQILENQIALDNHKVKLNIFRKELIKDSIKMYIQTLKENKKKLIDKLNDKCKGKEDD